MKQKRRSFLRTAIGALLAPLGMAVGVVVAKPSAEDRLVKELGVKR